MANDDLVNFRDELKSDFSSLWDDFEEVMDQMERDFDQDERNQFRDVMNNSDREEMPGELVDLAEEFGIAEDFRRAIRQADGLKSDLRRLGRDAAESNNVSQAVRDSADFSSVSEINRKCGNPNISTSDIEDMLGDDALKMVGGSIETFQDCVKAAAEDAGLSQDLKNGYGTA